MKRLLRLIPQEAIEGHGTHHVRSQAFEKFFSCDFIFLTILDSR